MLNYRQLKLSKEKVNNEQSILHTKHNLKQTLPLPAPLKKNRRFLQSGTQVLIDCMKILFL
jgi:hypothetical protein